MPDAEALNTVTFTDTGGHTAIEILVLHSSKEHRDAHINSGMEVGLQEAMDLLEEVAVSLSGPAAQRDDPLAALEPFVGEWSLEAVVPQMPPTDARGRVTFEWLPGGGFLVERWEIPFPAAPDGLAVIGFDSDRGTYLQHHFDSRGVARVYEMGFEAGVWTLSRGEPDFSPLDFAQRWKGQFSADGTTIVGSWETCRDGASWEHDFDLRYERIG